MDVAHILAVIAILLAGWFLYRHDWKKKPLTDFTQHLDSRDWRRYGFAIRELQKRGQDVTIYIPRVVSLLAADSRIERAMGQRVIENATQTLPTTSRVTLTCRILQCVESELPLCYLDFRMNARLNYRPKLSVAAPLLMAAPCLSSVRRLIWQRAY